MTINALCRTTDARHIALGLDQRVAFLDVDEGTITAQVETDSRPVRACTFDAERGRLGLVTDEQLVVIEPAAVRVSHALTHEHSRDVECCLRGESFVALVADADDRSALLIWDVGGS